MQSAFLGTVSHELRTPLTAIDGFARLLASPDLELSDDQQHDFLQRIIRNSQGLAILIEELLEYSRLDRGTFGLEAVDGDLLEMTRHVVDQLGIVIESHTVVVDGTPTPVHVDPSAITRIVTNLLTNAVRYSPDGTRVSVTVEPSTDAGWAVLTVDDEGPGVRPTDRRLVFERFWRGEQTDQAGTGIGLAVVGDLCALAGGRAEVTDAPDGGARFVVTLPVRSDAGANGTLVDGTLQRDV